MKLSVIVPCFNVASTISVQLEALAKQQWSEPWELIVADNGSTDASVAIAKQYQDKFSHLSIVNASACQGAAHARNVGAQAANGDALIFIDADDEVAPGWLAAMGKALSQYNFVVGRNDHKKLNEPWVIDCFQCEADTGIFENHPYLPLVGASNLGVKRSLHEAIGGFDESLFVLEDVDYGWRIQQAGTKPHYVPDALLHFRLRPTLSGIYRRAWNMGIHEPLLYKKHRPLGMPQLISWKTLVKASIKLPLQILLLSIRGKSSRAKWLMEFAWRGGQLYGCVKHRYLPV